MRYTDKPHIFVGRGSVTACNVHNVSFLCILVTNGHSCNWTVRLDNETGYTTDGCEDNNVFAFVGLMFYLAVLQDHLIKASYCIMHSLIAFL